MAPRLSISQEIKDTRRMTEWFTDIYQALCEAEPDDELRDHMARFGEAIEEMEEAAQRAQRESRKLTLQMKQLRAEVDAELERESAAPEWRRDCSIEIVESDAGCCIRCCREVGAGLIGWRWQPETVLGKMSRFGHARESFARQRLLNLAAGFLIGLQFNRRADTGDRPVGRRRPRRLVRPPRA